MMEKDHQEDITSFENATQDNEMDADIKAFAQKTLPTLRAHHDTVKKLDERINK